MFSVRKVSSVIVVSAQLTGVDVTMFFPSRYRICCKEVSGMKISVVTKAFSTLAIYRCGYLYICQKIIAIKHVENNWVYHFSYLSLATFHSTLCEWTNNENRKLRSTKRWISLEGKNNLYKIHGSYESLMLCIHDFRPHTTDAAALQTYGFPLNFCHFESERTRCVLSLRPSLWCQPMPHNKRF